MKLDYILAILAAVLIGSQFMLINNYKREINTLSSNLSQVVTANTSLDKELNATRELYLKGKERLAEIEKKKQTEVRYVTKYKEKIVSDNNASCVNTVNDIATRLQFKNNHY